VGKARQAVLAHHILRIACEGDNAARRIPGEAPLLGKDLITRAEVLEIRGEVPSDFRMTTVSIPWQTAQGMTPR
jgi:hypothetical protein